MADEPPSPVRDEERRAVSSEPLKPHYTILEREISQAVGELLQRPRNELFLSGVLAGFGLGLSLLLTGVVLSEVAPSLPDGVSALLLANAYAAGFIVVIMGRTDLFTEFATIAILPVLAGISPVRALGRLWALVYTSNLVGGVAVAGLIAVLGPSLGVIRPEVVGDLAGRLTEHAWWVVLLSGGLAGWLMGLLSWLVSAGRDTISQVFFIWLITAAIGLGHLHHAITGAVGVFAALFAGQGVGLRDLVLFLLWTTAGNALGGVLFAALIQYSVVIGGGDSPAWSIGGGDAAETRGHGLRPREGHRLLQHHR